MRRMDVLIVAVLLLLPGLAQAGPVRGLLSIGGDFGGDEILKVKYTDGSDASIVAGTGLLLTGGAVWQAAAKQGHALDLQASASWKYSTIPDASNQSISWTRWPLELLAFYGYLPAHVRLGGGLTYQLAPTLSTAGSLLNGDVKFQNALGELAQLDYTFADHFMVAARYTWISYRLDSGPGTTLNGNSAGFSIGYLF
jgi:hypothetical protein